MKEILLAAQLRHKPLLVCSGGTSSRCAANDHWTLDLRKRCHQINFDPTNKHVEIGAGLTMRELLNELAKHQRSFPIGLSGITGLGYILTGGVSPLSRLQGLAIDQILQFKGYWGNGEQFSISKPKYSDKGENFLKWKGLCGAAPFLAVVTSITAKTFPLKPLHVLQATLSPKQLHAIILQAETWPNNFSLQWSWGSEIRAFVVIQIDENNPNQPVKKILKELPNSIELNSSSLIGLQNMPKFGLEDIKENNSQKIHSEVIGLLGPGWSKNCGEIMKSLEFLIKNRPDPNCHIAAQQIGGVANSQSKERTSFVHRESIWKPWITASWPSGDEKARAKSLFWLKNSWKTLEPHCPGIHLAQMHPHLSWHREETKAAFGDWLPGLQVLKSHVDPNGILPEL